MNPSFIIYVFSYNRPEFLRNCLESIKYAAPGFPVCILDDNSDDLETVFLLSELSANYLVILGDDNDQKEFKTGGLSGAMNFAMTHARKGGYKYAIFIQDDMQFVRQFLNADQINIDAYFKKFANAFQLSTNFIRVLSANTYLDDSRLCFGAKCYIRRPPAERGKSNFSDTGVFHVKRFHDVFGKFEVGEYANSEKSRRLGLICGRSFYPFMCWLPYPISHRGKRRSFGHRVFEYFGRSGYYPIRMMTPLQAQVFLKRDPTELPVMERLLDAPESPRRDIWSTGGGEYNFLAYGSVAAKIFTLLRKWKRAVAR